MTPSRGVAVVALLLALLLPALAWSEKPDKTAIGKKPVLAGLKVEIQIVKLKVPLIRVVEGKKRTIGEIVEFHVTAAEPIPARALDPVLAVGKRLVTEYRYVRPNVLVFTEYEAEKIFSGEVVYFQWGKSPAKEERQATSVVFDREKIEKVVR
jgi:hypothetical protein